MTSSRQILTSFLFLQFMVNLERTGSWIPDAKSFSLTVTFYLTKTEDGTKKL